MEFSLLAAARAAKGFMPDDEGMALYQAGRQAAQSGLGPLLEVGTYCGKSAIYLGAAAREGGTVLFSVDHHRGSEGTRPAGRITIGPWWIRVPGGWILFRLPDGRSSTRGSKTRWC